MGHCLRHKQRYDGTTKIAIVKYGDTMIWYIINTIIGITALYFSIDVYIYYFGWIEYDEAKEKKRRKTLDEYGINILLCGIVMDVGGLVILYFNLPVLMYG